MIQEENLKNCMKYNNGCTALPCLERQKYKLKCPKDRLVTRCRSSLARVNRILWPCLLLCKWESICTVKPVKPSFEERFLAWQEAARLRKRPRPRYLGSTESASVREATCKSMLRSWPTGDVKEFWSVVGGLSALDLLHALWKQQNLGDWHFLSGKLLCL